MVLARPVSAKVSESAGQTLLMAPSARATSLGEALTAFPGDVTSAHYNPANITSVNFPEVSMLYQQQFKQESMGNIMFGATKNNYGFGVSAGYFDLGTIELYNLDTVSEVHGQQDYFVKLIGGRRWGPLSFGAAGTYFSTTLIEKNTARAWAGDIGATYFYSDRLSFGGSLQNIGTQLKYATKNESLPRLFRAGAAYKFSQLKFPTTMLGGYTRYTIENENEFSGGIEVKGGPLFLRSGLRKKGDLRIVSVGMGIQVKSWNFDYNVDLRQDFDPEQKFSIKYRFEPESPEPANEQKTLPVQIDLNQNFTTKPNRIYTTIDGDTWESVAKKILGSSEKISELKRMNQHLGNLDGELTAGQKIIVP